MRHLRPDYLGPFGTIVCFCAVQLAGNAVIEFQLPGSLTHSRWCAVHTGHGDVRGGHSVDFGRLRVSAEGGPTHGRQRIRETFRIAAASKTHAESLAPCTDPTRDQSRRYRGAADLLMLAPGQKTRCTPSSISEFDQLVGVHQHGDSPFADIGDPCKQNLCMFGAFAYGMSFICHCSVSMGFHDARVIYKRSRMLEKKCAAHRYACGN